MKLLLSITIVLFASTVTAENNGTFPSDFLFGVGSSAYQTEGAWNVDGKGENIWDHWVHGDPSHIKNKDTADIACDSYDYYADDIELASGDLGATLYGFSISWSRLLPKGFEEDINFKGVMYYQELIDLIITRNMTPVATLYYNDLPQSLQNIGGWTNPNMAHYFVEYARIAFRLFDRVKYWITFNEPRSACRLGYGEGTYAPGIALDGQTDYICAYTLVKSHAAVYHMYKTEFPNLKGKVSIAVDFEWSEPATNSTADAKAAERRNMFEFGLYANPIFRGNWPQVVINRVGNRSQNEHFTKSRLPAFTQAEIDFINGTFDFLATNIHYTTLVKDIPEPKFDDPGYMKDMKAEESTDPDWDVAPSGKPIVPWGARKSLVWLKNTYNDPEILITGNGVSDDGSTIDDDIRINFYREYLRAILDAMYEDNVRIFGYIAWSLLDGFEWAEGYSQHYGFYQVNLTNEGRSTKRKKSALFYHEITTKLKIPEEETTTSSTTSNTTSSTTSSTTSTTTPTTTTKPSSTTPSAANRNLFYPLIISVTTLLSYLLL